MKKYPIYAFTLKWSEPITDENKGKGYVGDQEGLPEGFYWNSIYHTMMFKEVPTDEIIIELVDKWFNQQFDKLTSKPKHQSHKIERKPDDSWILRWFSHYTILEEGITDIEYKKSFEEYVSRRELEIEKAKWETGDEFAGGTLMGAEDRWRWESGSKDYHQIPCRCEGCTKAGIVQIAH